MCSAPCAPPPGEGGQEKGIRGGSAVHCCMSQPLMCVSPLTLSPSPPSPSFLSDGHALPPFLLFPSFLCFSSLPDHFPLLAPPPYLISHIFPLPFPLSPPTPYVLLLPPQLTCFPFPFPPCFPLPPPLRYLPCLRIFLFPLPSPSIPSLSMAIAVTTLKSFSGTTARLSPSSHDMLVEKPVPLMFFSRP
ncbi:unnamed protein product [Closterium sp. Naga37s-1]|nr:unnamed protein product [Closterium sp. Naga37s-1]